MRALVKRALVFGGSGAVGAFVVRGLARHSIATTFTFLKAREKAEALAAETGARAVSLDLREPGAIRALIGSLDAEGAPELFIHCAAVSRAAKLAEITADDWDTAVAVNCRAAFVACQELAPRFAKAGGGEVVLVGALDRGQSLPMPIHFAASQGMLPAMAMALAKELGPLGARVNVVALGPLDSGMSASLPQKMMDDYRAFSALRRVGTPLEAARAILWLALENRYVSGRVMAVNGGI